MELRTKWIYKVLNGLLLIFLAVSLHPIDTVMATDWNNDSVPQQLRCCYEQCNSVTNVGDQYRTRLEKGRRALIERNIVSAWGLTLIPIGLDGHYWAANTETGTVFTYVGDTRTQALYQGELRFVATGPNNETDGLFGSVHWVC